MNFHEGGEEIKGSLKKLEKLVRLLIPDLYSFLSQKGVLHFFFCYRWVLIRFKREFLFEDIMRLWERLWTQFPGQNFWYFVCLAILQEHKEEIMKLTEFEDILQYINQLSGKMELSTLMVRGEDLFYRFAYLVQFIDDDDLRDISKRKY